MQATQTDKSASTASADAGTDAVHHSRQPATLRAYTNSTHTKAQALAVMQEHKRLDHIIQGTYAQGEGANFKGCLVGCATAGNHALFEPAFGIPWRLAWLADDIFEGLTPADAAQFAVDFFDQIATGADLSKVYDQWCAWMLGDAEQGLAAISAEPSVKQMAELFDRAASGDEPSADEWRAAARDARDAWDAWAARAAWAARDAWAAWAARAARAARDAWAARDARDARAAATAAHQRAALLRLLSLAEGTGTFTNPVPAASESAT